MHVYACNIYCPPCAKHYIECYLNYTYQTPKIVILLSGLFYRLGQGGRGGAGSEGGRGPEKVISV